MTSLDCELEEQSARATRAIWAYVARCNDSGSGSPSSIILDGNIKYHGEDGDIVVMDNFHFRVPHSTRWEVSILGVIL